MLLSCILLAQLITLSAADGWNLPTYVKFSINKYMNSSCSKSIDNNETNLLLYCRNYENSNGVPSCCYEQLDKLSPIEHTKFDTCYNVSTGNEMSYFQYKCSSENINETNLLQVFGVFGGICMAILGLILLAGMCSLCFKGVSHARYQKV